MIEHVRRQIVWQIQNRVVVININATNKFGFDIRLVRNRTNDVARFHAMVMTDSDTVSLHAWFGSTWAVFTSCAAVFTLKAIATTWTVSAVSAITAVIAIMTGRTLITPAIVRFDFATVFIEQQRFITACHLG